MPFATVSLLQGVSFQPEPDIEVLNLFFYLSLQIYGQINHLIDKYLSTDAIIGHFIQLQEGQFLMLLIKQVIHQQELVPLQQVFIQSLLTLYPSSVKQNDDQQCNQCEDGIEDHNVENGHQER